MKRADKIWLVLGAVLLLGGAVLFACVMTSLGWRFEALGTDRTEERTFEVKEGFSDIHIRCDTADVRFVSSDDGVCRITYRDDEKTGITVSAEQGTLTVTTEDNRKWYEHIGIRFGESRLTVALPGNSYGSLTVSGSTGDVSLPSGFGFESVEIDLSTGDVDCRASASDHIRIGTDTGDIRLRDLSARSMDLSVTTGDVEISSAVCGESLTLTVTTGGSVLTDVSCGSFTTSGTTGDVTLKNVTVSGILSIKRSTGDVAFENCDAGELSVETNTGDVTGTLLTEKVFVTQTGTGDVQVPGTANGGVCRITTGTGDIRIRIS